MKDVYRIYQAMDVFVFPSRYEGLGMAAVEAQFCGVKTILSQVVPKEAVISSNTEQLFLSDGITVWSKRIISAAKQDRSSVYSEIYDISVQADILTAFYGGIINERHKKYLGYTKSYNISRQQK